MTTYQIAKSAQDYKVCHKLLEEEGRDQTNISYPTIMAKNEGELTGVLATHFVNNMIFAGPVAIKRDRPHYWTFIRLIEAYDNVMRASGVTTYLFSVPNEETKYLEIIEKVLGLKPYAEQDGRKFFDRRL